MLNPSFLLRNSSDDDGELIVQDFNRDPPPMTSSPKIQGSSPLFRTQNFSFPDYVNQTPLETTQPQVYDPISSDEDGLVDISDEPLVLSDESVVVVPNTVRTQQPIVPTRQPRNAPVVPTRQVQQQPQNVPVVQSRRPQNVPVVPRQVQQQPHTLPRQNRDEFEAEMRSIKLKDAKLKVEAKEAYIRAQKKIEEEAEAKKKYYQQKSVLLRRNFK